MENFVIAIILLIIIILFTALNSFFICRICDDIIAFIDIGDTENAYKLWKEKKSYLALFIRDAEIDVVDSEANALSEETPVEDGEAEAGKLRFRDAVKELRNSEFPNFDGIF